MLTVVSYKTPSSLNVTGFFLSITISTDLLIRNSTKLILSVKFFLTSLMFIIEMEEER